MVGEGRRKIEILHGAPRLRSNGIDTLATNEPAHVLDWVMQPISLRPPQISTRRHPARCLALPPFHLKLRDVEDLLAQRGLMVSNESIRWWVLKFRPIIAKNLRESWPKAHCRWQLEKWWSQSLDAMYRWRAVDSEGEVLEILVQRQRDKAAACGNCFDVRASFQRSLSPTN